MEMAHRMAGAGKQVSLTEAQVLGFAAALSSVGIEAQMGGSAFSKALIKMEVASATGGDALEDFGKVAGMTGQQFKALWDSDPVTTWIICELCDRTGLGGKRWEKADGRRGFGGFEVV